MKIKKFKIQEIYWHYSSEDKKYFMHFILDKKVEIKIYFKNDTGIFILDKIIGYDNVLYWACTMKELIIKYT